MKKHCCWISYKWVNKIESGSHIKDIARKTIFPFSKCSEKMDFPKNQTGIWSFLYQQEGWLSFSPKIWSYSLETENEMIFLKKNTWKYDFFFKCSENVVFSKKTTGMRSFLYHQERWYFLFPKIWYFFYTRKVKDDLSKKCMEIWCFLYIR